MKHASIMMLDTDWLLKLILKEEKNTLLLKSNPGPSRAFLAVKLKARLEDHPVEDERCPLVLITFFFLFFSSSFL